MNIDNYDIKRQKIATGEAKLTSLRYTGHIKYQKVTNRQAIIQKTL